MKFLFFSNAPRSVRVLYKKGTNTEHFSPNVEAQKNPTTIKELQALKKTIQNVTPGKTEKLTKIEKIQQKNKNPEKTVDNFLKQSSEQEAAYAEYRQNIEPEATSHDFSIAKFEENLPPGFNLPRFATNQFA